MNGAYLLYASTEDSDVFNIETAFTSFNALIAHLDGGHRSYSASKFVSFEGKKVAWL